MRTHTKQPTQIDTARFVRSILERNRRPDAQLEDLVIRYNSYDSIGRLDPSEREAAMKSRREEMMKKYDKNGDGKLDAEESKAMNDERRKDREAALTKQRATQEQKKDEKKEEKKEEKN